MCEGRRCTCSSILSANSVYEAINCTKANVFKSENDSEGGAHVNIQWEQQEGLRGEDERPSFESKRGDNF